MILETRSRLEGHLPGFTAIQTHLSHRFYLAMDFLDLRRSGSSSQIINQAQDFLEQASRHGNLDQLEGDSSTSSATLNDARSVPATYTVLTDGAMSWNRW